MQEVVRLHDGVLRAVIAAQGGAVFKTIGDAFCAAFEDARAAALAAVTIQRALQDDEFSAAGGVRFRIALHTGVADERDGDYFGPAVNRVARLLSLAHGGQILLSGTTADVVSGSLERGLTLRDLGKHRLKDIPEPLEIHQLLADGIPSDFPPLRAQNPAPGNLPSETTSFVGRENETDEIANLVREHRLVTLVGAGGIGKTRLALHAAGALVAHFDDGVWFVELAPISDAGTLAARIAETMGLQLPTMGPDVQALAEQLAPKNVLLLLDNCEHVVGAAAHVAETLLRACPRVKILATSREALGVAGEQRYRTPPLGIGEAVSLFTERARAADHKFVLDENKRPSVEEICRRLDGIALAIELAAARLNVLSLRALAERLDERFRLLAGGSRTALPRQRTLRALIDWSYDLLDDAERAVFRRLSVFAGGFALELVGDVCGDEYDELTIVQSLVDKSLVHVEEVGDERRYDLLETIREYARERLRELGEEPDTARRHASAYLELARELNESVESVPDSIWSARAKLELDNWNAALRRTLKERLDVDLGRRLAVALRLTWSRLGPAEGKRAILAAIESVDEKTQPEITALLHLAYANLSLILLEYHAVARSAVEAMQLFQAIEDERGLAEARFYAGSAHCMLGDTELGQVLLREALELFRRLDERRMVAASLQALGVARLSIGDASARELLREALQLYRSIPGAARAASHIALNLAEADFIAGEAESALVLAREALAADRAIGARDNEIFALSNLAAYLCALRRGDEASAYAREAIALARERNAEIAIVWSLQHLAAAAALRGQNGQSEALQRSAACLLGFVDEWIARRGVAREYTEQREYEELRWTLARALGDDEVAAVLEEGAQWELDRALSIAAEL
jgi:predicted ATPase